MTDMPPYLTPLGADDLRALNIPEPWRFGTADRVRFYEIDALNHVNNTAYLRWFETLRIPYFAAYGLSDYRPEDPQLVLRRVSADYIAPVYLGESYVVTGRTVSFRSSSFVMAYAIFVEGEMRATGEAVIVSLEPDGTAKRPLTEAMRKTLIERDGATHVG